MLGYGVPDAQRSVYSQRAAIPDAITPHGNRRERQAARPYLARNEGTQILQRRTAEALDGVDALLRIVALEQVIHRLQKAVRKISAREFGLAAGPQIAAGTCALASHITLNQAGTRFELARLDFRILASA